MSPPARPKVAHVGHAGFAAQAVHRILEQGGERGDVFVQPFLADRLLGGEAEPTASGWAE